MKRPGPRILKILGGIIAAFIILLLIFVGILHTSWVQDRALKQINILLRQTLQTKVEVGRAKLSLFGEKVSVYDVMIEDRQERQLFKMHKMGVDISLWRLLFHEVYVTDANIDSLTAHIYKPATDRDSVANYQFILDAFKRKKKDDKTDSLQSQKKGKLTVDVERVNITHIYVSYNDSMDAALEALHYKMDNKGRRSAVIKELSTDFVAHSKKGPVDTQLRISRLHALLDEKRGEVTIDSIYYLTDNRLPRKNKGKPKRGFFDAGHLDVALYLHLTVDSLSEHQDAAFLTLDKCQGIDHGSGLTLSNLSSKVVVNKQQLLLSGVNIQMPHTSLSFDHAHVVLPSKKEGRVFAFQTSTISGSTQLRDISKPFAPVLHNFTIPLQLETTFRGNADSLIFNKVRVRTGDKRLKIQAKGLVTGLKNKYQLKVHFDVQQMATTGAQAIRIINQFAVKKFMLKQLQALGGITYTGSFDVLWKREQFFGTLHTSGGNLRVQLALDEKSKYLFGHVRTTDFHLGRVMDMSDLGDMTCQAKFRFDYSKPRTAAMRRRLGGKLPIGNIEAEIDQAAFKGVKFKNIIGTIVSDGAVANGDVKMRGKFVDVVCGFSFTNTDEMKKTKIKPGIRFHGASGKDDAEKKQEKAARRAARDSADAAKAMEKAERKSAKAAEKAARLAKKTAEKAAKKARKDSLKAARRAARH